MPPKFAPRIAYDLRGGEIDTVDAGRVYFPVLIDLVARDSPGAADSAINLEFMADTSDFRNGYSIVWNGDIWTIIEFQHVKPGKGPAFVRTKLRNVRAGKVVDNTFRAGEKVEAARVERRKHQFLYEDDLGLHFMNTETYEQTSLPVASVSGREFIKEGANIDIIVHAETEQALTTEIPLSVELLVTLADPGLKGDTATGATKPATLETGAIVNVPLFVNEGDLIRVNTEKGEYITRVSD